PEHLAAFEETLKTERRLLEERTAVLGAQRLGVSRNDLSALDDSVFAAQRILRTLAEARRRHRTLLAVLVGRDDLSLQEVEEALGPNMPLGTRRALYALHEAAHRLADELEQNRRILDGAITAGETLLRALTGGTHAPAVYASPGAGPRASRSALVDRQA
ncbi:MAG: flagellar protein FlgN, partial [Gemmatimonadetes bacterium]|nr:flagellar protein FlgN [Gemmatimonadota bacterium]